MAFFFFYRIPAGLRLGFTITTPASRFLIIKPVPELAGNVKQFWIFARSAEKPP
jgi:hypothetical protein